MTAHIINGQEIAKEVRAEVAKEVARLKAARDVTPGLAVVLVGDDPASAAYVRNKGRACDEVGIFSETFKLPADSSQEEVEAMVERLNRDARF
ncbi:MAG: bifunctional 5,10-methylene-tetrahydrofolate dehydrogenase/5,10-methylene-tetrahydrofolate cyclohydrolase, partial [Dehalococcoidia bacterium]|nr:bifunctional 5,10-methylene-tetrahydrofolate dehydrogenase/5,10-methylene-tetrahydrofolate cyclohydrolase [Dehalococcoidia bacterium]